MSLPPLQIPAAHILVDWGTSSFRLWALDAAGTVLAERRSGEGLAAGAAAGFEAVLESHLAALGIADGVPAVICGMAGSRTGWREAAYLDTPIGLADLAAQAVEVPAARRPVRILPGLAQRRAGAHDVIRGEETQLLPLGLAGHTGLVCQPGTHSKWVRLETGRVEDFATFMTGELFQLLRAQSVLAPAVESEIPVEPGPSFLAGIEAALAAPAGITHHLFALRADWLLAGVAAAEGLAKLSGLLIGVELAGARSRYGKLDGTVLIASGATARLYAAAFEAAGIAGFATRDAEASVRAGLAAAAASLFPIGASL